ncbi:MAG: HSP90 family protein [Lachnospiraceae bacterium]|nr:HSP90 family protein [Lachnospiraceae bacterium]
MPNSNFKVDLKGIIRLLSDSLYSSDKVFLRELLQNAADAIDARKKADPSYAQGAEGRITVTYRQKKGGAQLIFTDNGIGMTREEIRSFLSVIGQSSKRSDDAVRNSFIGQFGIGILSCFLVTNEIKVLTRSVTEEKPCQWIGKSDGSYAVTESKKQMEPGTQVYVELTGAKYEFFSEQEIINDLSEYGFLLRIPICFDGENQKKILNDNVIPWRRQLSMADEIMSFGEQVFEETFFDVIPLNGGGINGYAYISTRQVSANTAAQHKIYLKNMYVTDDGRDLIPKWAFFTRCIVNFNDLTPTASREGFTKNHKLLEARNQIEKCMFDYFVLLSEMDVRKLKHITLVHNVAIKSLVMENDQIFKLFFPFLTFPTSQGTLTGFQIVNASKTVPVNYCVEIDDFRRLCPLLEGTKSLLVNGGYIYDAGILQKLPKYYKNVKIAVFDTGSYENLLADPPEEFKAKMEGFRYFAEQGLTNVHCGVSFKSFAPGSLQALFVPGEDVVFDQALDAGGFSGFFENFDFGDADKTANGNKLYLNSANSFIQSLSQIHEEELAKNIIQVIYIQALLAGHYTLGGGELELMNKSLQKLMEYALYGKRGED